jgi:hypothetical protein
MKNQASENISLFEFPFETEAAPHAPKAEREKTQKAKTPKAPRARKRKDAAATEGALPKGESTDTPATPPTPPRKTRPPEKPPRTERKRPAREREAGGRPSAFKKKYVKEALAVMKEGGSLAAVAARLNVCRATLYNWQKKHPEFDQAIQLGGDLALAFWEDVLSQQVLGNTRGSVTGALFILKNRWWNDYQDKAKKDITINAIDAESAALMEKIFGQEINTGSDQN